MQTAQAAASAAQVSTATIEANLGAGIEGQQVSAAANGDTRTGTEGIGNTLLDTVRDVNPSTITQIATDARPAPRAPALDPTGSSRGGDDPTSRVGRLIVVIPRP
jgi:hypothetical protein